MPGMPQLPSTSQETRYSYPPGFCVSACPVEKLSPYYIGPFTIQRQINEVTYQLQLPPRYRIHPTFHVSLLKTFSPSTPEPHEPPPPEILDQPSVYRVIDNMDSRRRAGVPSRLGRLWSRRTFLGGPGRYPWSHAAGGIPSSSPWLSRTQRPWSSTSLCEGFRSRPWRRG